MIKLLSTGSLRKAGFCLALPLLLLAVLLAGIGWLDRPSPRSLESSVNESAAAEATFKAARSDYFHRMLLDPSTSEIPRNIRRQELAWVRSQQRARGALRSEAQPARTWDEVGPNDIGGRTRALAFDIADPDTMLAGGAAGGLWKSIDGGRSWKLKSAPNVNPSVTALAQDPRIGHRQTWYYGTGELIGSNADQGFVAAFEGEGLYKSSDNGESWRHLAATRNRNPTTATGFSDDMEFVSRIAVSPLTGTVLVASSPSGVFRSSNQGSSFIKILGDNNFLAQADVAVASDGRFLAAVSAPALLNSEVGVFLSVDDGISWTSVTPPSLPEGHDRTIVAFAPSNPDAAYLFSRSASFAPFAPFDNVSLHRLNLALGTSQDLSANLPNFSSFAAGSINTQSSYNMVLAVKPDDERFLVLGGWNLLRSRDAFSTRVPDSRFAEDVAQTRIGGYAITRQFDRYPNHHPDQHVALFDPSDPNVLWSGNDGGIYRTEDVQAAVVEWEDRNRGFNVTQFYSVCQSGQAGDSRLAGGTQDNGSLFLRQLGALTTPTYPALFADGGYCHLGETAAYLSTQGGFVVRFEYDDTGFPSTPRLPEVRPPSSTGRLFVHPVAVDPHEDWRVYYPAGGTLWRHPDARELPRRYITDRENWGWEPLVLFDGLEEGRFLTALAISTQPADVLYVGASSLFLGDGALAPRLYRFDNIREAEAGSEAEDVSPPGLPAGAYLHNIAVNPANANELLVVFSNYNIIGLFHSLDGGRSYSEVEGNLEGDPGPSLRWASILPRPDGAAYFVGTSAGLFSTDTLQGADTIWKQEGADTIGSAIIAGISARPSDGRIAVATHGRGFFVSAPPSADRPPQPVSELPAAVFPMLETEGLFTGYAVSNHADQLSQVLLQAWGQEGGSLSRPYLERIPAGNQLSRLGQELFNSDRDSLSQSSGWVEMGSSHNQLGSFMLFGDGQALDGAVSQRRQSLRFVFPRVHQGQGAFRDSDAVSVLHVVNPNRDTIVVEVSLRRPDADALRVSRTIPAKGMLKASLDQLFPSADLVTQGYVEVEVREGPGAVGFQRIRFPQSQTSVAINGLIDDGALELRSAQFAQNEGLFSNLSLVNTALEARTATLRIVADDGSQIAQEAAVDLPGGHSVQLNAAEIFDLPQGAVGSLTVSTDGPGVLGSLLLGDPESMRFAALVPLQATPFATAVFSQIADGQDVFTGMAILNPAQAPAAVTVEAFGPDGGSLGETQLELPPGGRRSFLLPQLLPRTQGVVSGRVEIRCQVPVIAQQLFGQLDGPNMISLAAVPPTRVDP